MSDTDRPARLIALLEQFCHEMEAFREDETAGHHELIGIAAGLEDDYRSLLRAVETREPQEKVEDLTRVDGQ